METVQSYWGEVGRLRAPRTLAEATYRLLREDIVWGKLAPDTPLRSDDLRRDYDIGISPLREALARLASERLVIASGQKGFRVAPLDAEDVLDTMETRLVLETDALRRSIRQGDEAWRMRVRSSYDRLVALPSPREPGPEATRWALQHRDFHMALLSASGSRWMLRLAHGLFDQAERHRIVVYIDAVPDTVRDRDAEHRAIMDAAFDRDEPRAVHALDSHYRTTAEMVANAIAQHGHPCCA